MRYLIFTLVALAIAFLTPTLAVAHTAVIATSIAEDAHLGAAPETFSIEFAAPVGLAAIALTDASGHDLALDFDPPRTPAARFVIPLPQITTGSYTLSWRSIARDGHVAPGAVHFVIVDD